MMSFFGYLVPEPSPGGGNLSVFRFAEQPTSSNFYTRENKELGWCDKRGPLMRLVVHVRQFTASMTIVSLAFIPI